MRGICVVGFASLAVAAAAHAQSINLLFGPNGAAVPDPSYGAVGPAGYWNLVSPNSPAFLRTLDGSLTTVANFVPPDFAPVTWPPVGPTGNDALLLSSQYASNNTEITVSGLANGPYNVIFYGLNYELGFVAFFGGQGGSQEAYLAGTWQGQLAPGIYATMPFSITDGTLSFEVSYGFEGGIWSAMQIVQVPGPGSISFAGLGGALFAARRRRR